LSGGKRPENLTCWRLAVCLCGSLAITLAVLLSGNQSLAAETQPLLVVGPEGAKPYLFKEDGGIKGIVPDILEEITSLSGQKFDIKVMDFRAARDLVREGKADIVAPLSLSPTRKAQFDFTDPLLNIVFTVFARENETYPAEWPNREDVRIGVFGKGMSLVLAKKHFPKAKLVTVNGALNAMRAVQRSEVDAMITARRTGYNNLVINGIGNVVALPITLLSIEAGLAVTMGNKALVRDLNVAIRKLKAEGTIDRILDEWESSQIVLFSKGEIWTATVGILAAVAAIFLALVVFYVRRLRVFNARLQDEIDEHLHTGVILQESEERFRRVVDKTPVPIIVLERGEKIVLINKAFTEQFGYVIDDIPTREIWLQSAYPDQEYRDYVLSHWAPAVEAAEMGDSNFKPQQWRVTTKDGIERIVEFQYFSISDDRHATTLRDVTERLKFEQNLKLARDEAEQANKAKSEFLASMSHELRTPLNAILGFAQMLDFDPTQPLTERQGEHVESIMKGGTHLLDLVNEILDLSRIEAEQLVLTLEAVDANEVIADCVSLTEPLGEYRNIRIENTAADQSVVFLQTDMMRFKQALLNLLSNAVKYNKDNGKVTISARQTDDHYLHIAVKDTGIGIAEEDHETVFQMFHRLNADSTIAREGTGIGLTVTKLLIERMAGRIGYESHKDTGSTFWIELPLQSNNDVLFWTNHFNIGIDAIDKDHQTIFALTNQVLKQMGEDTDELVNGLSKLIDYTGHHFRREEAVLEACRYPDLEGHRGEHKTHLAKLEEIAIMARENSEPEALLNAGVMLRNWLFEHIINVDVSIVKHTRGRSQDIRKALEDVS
jgi:hemerythrin-like metal-binding protein/PAS domain S-box-containing protein